MSGGLTRSPELGHENELLSKKADDRDGALGKAMPDLLPTSANPVTPIAPEFITSPT